MAFTPLSHRRKTGNPTSRRTKGIIVVCLIIGFLIFRHIKYTEAVNNGFNPADTKTQLVLIQKGDSAKSVGKLLEQKKIIKNASYFSDYLSDQNEEDKILAGRFELNPSMPIKQIAEIVTDSKQARNYLTVPEGYTVKQIDDKLAEEQLIKSGDFIDSVKKFTNWQAYPFLPKQEMIATQIPLEGFLFPDTYKIDAGNFSSESLIDLMLQNFKRKLPADITTQLSVKNISLFELITTASMIEKEVRHPEDLPIVAGIIWKRAQSGWMLNIDATLIYDLKRQNLTKNDLKQDSPYNTYTRKGLPPGPIGNPGIKTILASLNPVKTSHWFYITDPKSGKAIFADSNDQQNRNRAIYLK
ncbi:MAG: endolytic transglycosylase MltG [Candidatus Gracilibacteria bacterium]|nr:endolytic transglycosylase MltG [Candidatus Gracilibacteria bacterium]